MEYKLHNGESAETLKQYPDNHFHSVVADPPYMLSFLGKDWDGEKVDLTPVFEECYRVLRPGGYLLAFSSPRTYHRTAIQIEDAGFDIKDQIMWLFLSGFPKGGNTAKKIDKHLKNNTDDYKESVDIEEEDLTLQENNVYKHNKTGALYRKLPDIKGDKLLKSQDCVESYGTCFEKISDKVEEKDLILQKDGYYCHNITGKLYKRYPDHRSGNYGKKLQTGESYSYYFQPVYTPTSDVAEQWDDYSTSLKPAHEPIVVARKPTKLSTAENCIKHGVGAMNIGACRIPYESEYDEKHQHDIAKGTGIFPWSGGKSISKSTLNDKPSAGKRTSSYFNSVESGETQSGGDGSGDWTADDTGRWASNVIGEIKGYEKFFYSPKVSSKERALYMDVENKPFSNVAASQGTDMLDTRKALNETEGRWNSGGEWKTVKKQGNTHPTVKPIDLMRYLCRLVTPKGGIVLDPFMGSGSTGMAAAREGFDFVGIEMSEVYYDIAERRVSAEYDAPSNNIFGE